MASKKGDLSKFIEEAVKWGVLDQTVARSAQQIRRPAARRVERVIEEAVAAGRKVPAPKPGRCVRLVVDTNILISALLAGTSFPAHLITLWREGRFDLVTLAEQLDELMRVTRARYPKIRERFTPALAGRLINELREVALVVKCGFR